MCRMTMLRLETRFAASGGLPPMQVYGGEFSDTEANDLER